MSADISIARLEELAGDHVWFWDFEDVDERSGPQVPYFRYSGAQDNYWALQELIKYRRLIEGLQS